jgi:hypothetical protein
VKQKHSKAIEMQFYWIHEHVWQGQNHHLVGHWGCRLSLWRVWRVLYQRKGVPGQRQSEDMDSIGISWWGEEEVEAVQWRYFAPRKWEASSRFWAVVGFMSIISCWK